MKIESLNLGQPKRIEWRGKTVLTGIFKYPVDRSIYLGTEDVKNDSVVDRKYHGGIDKACYSYSAEAYDFWKKLYPDSKFEYGFFGENLTVSQLNEIELKIGSQYRVGDAIIEVSQPREPCFKLGIRFGSQKILKPFINCNFPGAYFRVLKAGPVASNDQLKLVFKDDKELTVLQTYQLIYGLISDKRLAHQALKSDKLGHSAKKGIAKQFNLNFQ